MLPFRNTTGEFEVVCDDGACQVPEHRLMLAVLEDALVTFQSGLKSSDPLRRQYFCEVGRWVKSTDSESPFSFENICSTLGLDPDYIRAGLCEMRRRAMQPKADVSRLKIRRETIQHRRSWRGQVGQG